MTRPSIRLREGELSAVGGWSGRVAGSAYAGWGVEGELGGAGSSDDPGLVVDEAVVVAAEQDHVRQRGGSAVDPVHEVVGVAHDRWPGAVREAAVPVAEDQGLPDRGGDQALGAADVEDRGTCAEDRRDHLGVAAQPADRGRG